MSALKQRRTLPRLTAAEVAPIIRQAMEDKSYESSPLGGLTAR
jgi:hypothetical protein